MVASDISVHRSGDVSHMTESDPQTAGAAANAPRFTVVAPMKNEQGNVALMVEEIAAACDPIGPFETRDRSRNSISPALLP